MSSRHLPRQPDRDVRMHEPPPQQHNLQHPQHPPPHVVHLNGNSSINIPPSGISNGATISPSTNPTAVPNGAPTTSTSSVIHKLNVANEQTWLLIGRVAEQLGDLDKASIAYDHALRHNPHSLSGLTQIAGIARIKEDYPKAVDYFQRVLKQQEENGEVWSALGHCYLMQDDLQKAYSAYQQALYLLPNPKEDPKLWYGIGILYDRYGSLDHAEEAFSSVLRMDKDLDFDRANEILFRLGIIYKQQQKYEDSLACFDRILRNPPSPLAHADIWFQIGHVFEQQKDHSRAKDAYERVVADNPGHGKVLQQLGWLYHQDGTSFQNQDLAITYLTKSLEAEPADAQSWYLLGRAYMAGQKYNKAYEAYQQAVYRDGRNPTFWCSIGVLYFQINQFRDALDAYSRAIRINPYISEVWFDLGSLYESCNNQITDAIDAYARASELDPSNPAITQRLQLLKTAQATGGQLPAAPGPQDVHPTAYTSATVPPTGISGPPLLLQSANHRPAFRTDSGPMNEISLPPPSQVHKSPPFGGRAPPPVVIDESRHPSNNLLGPMEVDRPRDYPGPLSREPASRGPVGHQSLLLQQPVQHQPGSSEEFRNGSHGHHQESFFTRPPPRQHSRSASPAPHNRVRSPPPPFQAYPAPRQASGPAQPSRVSVQRSPRIYPANTESSRPVEQEGGWNRRPTPGELRDWDQEMERRPGHEYSSHPPPPPSNFYPPRSPGPSTRRDHSPPAPSPRTHPSRYWEGKPMSSASRGSPPVPPAPSHQESSGRRYDPRYDGRESRDYEVNETRSFAGSPEGTRNTPRNPPPHLHVNTRESESPAPGLDSKDRRRRLTKDKEPEEMPLQPQPQPPQPTVSLMQEPAPKKERKKRLATKRGGKDEQMGSETPKLFVAERGPSMPGNYKHGHGYSKGPGSPEPASSNGSGSSRSVQPSPTSVTARPPSRVVDDDYDEGVDALMGLASYRGGPEMSHSNEGASRSPPVSTGSRHSVTSPRPHTSHRNSVSSTRSHASPPTSVGTLKRTLSPGSEESDNKRSRVDSLKRRSSPSGGRRTPVQSTRPSPIPFRTQPASHSPEARQHEPYPPSPPLPVVVLPPHPRPIGAGLSQVHMGGSGGGSAPIALPPIATLSPPSTAASPSERGRDERMQIDPKRSTSNSPSTRGKMSDSGRPSSRSPSSKHTASPGSDKKESS